MKITKDEWISWLKCNVLEIAILVLVLVLVVKVFSAPAVAGLTATAGTLVVEVPAVSEEVPIEGAPAVAEIPLEEPAAAEEVPAGETPTE